MEEKVIKKMEESINKIIEEGVTTNNLDNLYKLSKIKHMAKEDEKMNYGEYGARRPGFDSYGRYDNYGNYDRGSYGARGRDMRYRGDEHIDRMSGEYGRYMENRSRYGAGEETDRSFHYMIKSLEDFIKVLYEEADTQQQKQHLREALQRSMM